MSKPSLNPDKTAAGIAVDPQTLERVIPESKRPDGTVRKQIKIRPGFTPQEDVRRFRGTKQAQMDATTLPKGHIIGWAPPPQSSISTGPNGKPMSKSAKKNAKRREKKEEKKETIPDNWDDEDDAGGGSVVLNPLDTTDTGPDASQPTKIGSGTDQKQDITGQTTATPEPDPAAAAITVNGLASKLEKLQAK
ncbi:hypothetical protein BDZ94DRAFT_1290153 [Collybia nuda]|uniref:WIBG Mago-binding domain-containing protein n=1 Tax=Collybia nuda TaxID=64659 RepID=A0A9P5Y4K0_9AGAR|nr:hypothetical protein BDZ94DRAFT_1290153 [Collybia nuda]